MIGSFAYTMLLVSNMNASVEFYKKILEREPEFTSFRWSQFRVGNAFIALHDANSWSDENDPLRSFGAGQKGQSYAVWTDDLEKEVARLKKENITIAYGPRVTGIGNLIYIIDPDGYYIQIVEAKQTPKE